MIAIEPVRQEAETTFMGASAINMQRLVDNAIDKLKAQGEVPAEIASLIRLNVLETLADDLKARGAGRFAIRRAENIIEGYQKTNLKEVLKDYIDGWSGMITKQEAALEFLEGLKGFSRSKPQLMAYGSKYAQDMLRNQEPMDRISAKMRSMAFIYFLGGSMRAALVNFTQNYVTGIPFLAREVGAKSLKAEKLYHKAMFEIATGKSLSEVENKMLEEMLGKGITEASVHPADPSRGQGRPRPVDRESCGHPGNALFLDGAVEPQIGSPGHVPGETREISWARDEGGGSLPESLR